MQLSTTTVNHLVSNWRRRLQGLGGNPQPFFRARIIFGISTLAGFFRRCIAAICASSIAAAFAFNFLLIGFVAQAEEISIHEGALRPAQALSKTEKKWTNFLPYAPDKHEYNAEIGGMWEENNLYWLGFTYGRHLGRCIFANSDKCHQFFDITGGSAGRQAYSESLVLGGVRWQYVSFPNPYSPSFGLFGGVMNIRTNSRDRQVGVYGVGVGYTVTLHEKLNVKWQNRIGGGDHLWVQSMLSISLKIDSYVDAFADRMKKIGKGAIETTGTVIKSTITAPKSLFDWFNGSSSSDSKKSSDSAEPEKSKSDSVGSE